MRCDSVISAADRRTAPAALRRHGGPRPGRTRARAVCLTQRSKPDRSGRRLASTPDLRAWSDHPVPVAPHGCRRCAACVWRHGDRTPGVRVTRPGVQRRRDGCRRPGPLRRAPGCATAARIGGHVASWPRSGSGNRPSPASH